MNNRAEVLKMSVESLGKSDLLEIIKNMIDDPSAQAVVQKFLPLSTRLLKDQPQDKVEVARLIDNINQFVENFEVGYDGYDEEEEEEGYDVLDGINDQAAFLHPQDCMNVTRHMLIKTQQIFGNIMFDTKSLEQALRLYGGALSQVKIDRNEKQDHCRWLISLLKTEAAGYGEFSETVGEALLHAATTPEDYTFLVDELQDKAPRINNPNIRTMLCSCPVAQSGSSIHHESLLCVG